MRTRRERRRLAKLSRRLGPALLFQVSQPQIAVHVGVGRLEPQRFLERGDRLVEPLLAGQRRAQVVVSFWMLWPRVDRRPISGLGRRPIAAAGFGNAQVVVRFGVARRSRIASR